MADEIKYNKDQLNVAEHYMTTGHEYNPEVKKEEKSEQKVEDNTDKQ